MTSSEPASMPCGQPERPATSAGLTPARSNITGPARLDIASIRLDVEAIRDDVEVIHDRLTTMLALTFGIVVIGVITALLVVWL